MSAAFVVDGEEAEEDVEVEVDEEMDPRGWIPPFLINMVSSRITPNLVAAVHANALKYPEWKAQNRPEWKPWLTGYDPQEKPYQQHDPNAK